MPTTLRVIAILELLAGILLTLWCWFGAPESFFLGIAFLLSGLISAAVFMALAQILENSEALRSDIVRLRHDLWGELSKLRDGGAAPGRPPSPPPPRPSTSPIRESTDPITGRVSYLFKGVTYDSRLAAVAQLSEDERRGQRQPGLPASE